MRQVKVKKGMSQNDIVLAHLKLNPKQGLSEKEAGDLYGIRRLGARVWELRHQEGLSITTGWETEKNRYGVKTRYGRYILERTA